MVLYPNKLPESERVCFGICKLAEYFKAHSFLQRRDFERLTGFNSSKSTRVIRELVKDGVLKNAGTKFQPVYVVGEKG